MRTYSSYKNSELKYYENIPSNWELKRLCDVIGSGKGSFTGGPFGSDLKVNDYTDDGVRIIQLQNIGVGYFLNDYKIYTSIEKANELYSCNIFPNEIIISKMADPVARACLIPNFESRFVMASDGIRLVPDKHNFNRYLVYAINSIHFNYQAVINSFGSTRLRIGLNTLKKLNIILPPFPEQTAIAQYLDTKTQAIDKKVNLLEKKIVYYKELRKSIINETVTKGLDKNVKLKDSGIDWIGQIPEHWEVKRLKEIASIQTGNTPPMADKDNYSELGMPWVKPNDLIDFVPIVDSTDKISPKGERIIRRIKKDSILVCCIGSIGKMGIAGIDLCTNQQINAITFNFLINPAYGKFLIYSSQNEHLRVSTGNVVAILNADSQKRIEFAVPPKAEQIIIATYLDHKTQTIDKIVGNIQNQISTLKELRKTLINDVVTGKIKVVV